MKLSSVNTGQRVGVLRTGLFKVCEVDAHPPFPTSLFYQHHVRQPLRVLNLPDVASPKQLLYLFFDDLTPFVIKLLPSLANRSDLGVHGETMTQEVRIYARHVRGRPCKSIKVSCYDFSNLILCLLA